MSLEKVYDENGWMSLKDTSPTVLPIRKLTTRAFMQRLTAAQRIVIRKSLDDYVIDFHEDLKMASFVDLDSSDVAAAISHLKSQGLIDEATATALLLDGTDAEAS